MAVTRHPASFRDPSGYIFYHEGLIHRWVSRQYGATYEAIVKAGLFSELFEKGWLIPHQELDLANCADAYRILRPQQLPLISYPFEWCFGQLKSAALLTLEIQLAAMARGFSLKDASNYNIQFRGAAPVLIDSLSFESYAPGRPWIAYRQFCQHFLAPLLLMHYRDARLVKLLSNDVNGIPLEVASKLLPWTTLANFSILSHIHLHARSSAPTNQSVARDVEGTVSRAGLVGIVENLRSVIRGLKCEPSESTWRDYYSATNYSDESLLHKQQIVESLIEGISPRPDFALDFGGNTGKFSRLFSTRSIYTASLDMDHSCVEINFREAQKDQDNFLLPLVFDLTNPSPGIGWANDERAPLLGRVNSGNGIVMALALIHHLVISNNVPMDHVAQYFSQFGPRLIIEFVPVSDSQVQRLLATRLLPADYSEDSFCAAMSQFYPKHTVTRIQGSDRSVYFYEK